MATVQEVVAQVSHADELAGDLGAQIESEAEEFDVLADFASTWFGDQQEGGSLAGLLEMARDSMLESSCALYRTQELSGQFIGRLRS